MMKFEKFEKMFVERIKFISKNSTSKSEISSHSRNFLEGLERLYVRGSDLEEAMRCGDLYDDHTTSQKVRDAQTNLVSKTESFHEGVYATLSDLAMLLELILPHPNKRGFQSTSVSSLLKLLQQQLPIHQKEVGILNNSYTYRQRYVSHRNQNPVFDWYTMGIGTIVYYPKELSKRTDDSFFTPPNYTDVIESLEILALASVSLEK